MRLVQEIFLRGLLNTPEVSEVNKDLNFVRHIHQPVEIPTTEVIMVELHPVWIGDMKVYLGQCQECKKIFYHLEEEWK